MSSSSCQWVKPKHPKRPNLMGLQLATYVATMLSLALAFTPVASWAQPLPEKTLHDFGGPLPSGFPDGAIPCSQVSFDLAGNMYGATVYGGAGDGGTIWKLTPAGAYTVLHQFDYTDGYYPVCGTIIDAAGNLYGSSSQGGQYGYGTVWKLAPDGTFSVLHSFEGTDGAHPMAGVTFDSAGNLYGTAEYGGANGGGTIWEVTSGGLFVDRYDLNPPSDGKNPTCPVAVDSAWNLYGTTQIGGPSGAGSIWMLTPGGSFTLLADPAAIGDGNLISGVTLDSGGDIFGTTPNGGSYGYGAVYKLAPGGVFTNLWSFGSGADGANPYDAPTLDAAGNLYGLTAYGGAKSGGVSNLGGNIWKLSSSGSYTDLYDFGGNLANGSPDGLRASSAIGVTFDATGNLYGTDQLGGAYASGTIWEAMTPSAVAISGFTASPSFVLSGQGANLTVSLNSPAGASGTAVTITGWDAAVTGPSSVLVPSGLTSRSFSAATSPVAADTVVTLFAHLGASVRATTLTVIATPISFSQSVQATLSQLGTLPNSDDEQHLLNCLADLAAANSPTLWLASGQPNPQTGQNAFNDWSNAENELFNLEQHAHGAVPLGALVTASQNLDSGARLAAVTAMASATPQNSSSAQNELTQGDQNAAAGNYQNAIGHYKNAWMHALGI